MLLARRCATAQLVESIEHDGQLGDRAVRPWVVPEHYEMLPVGGDIIAAHGGFDLIVSPEELAWLAEFERGAGRDRDGLIPTFPEGS
jgi:hypothetical protein